MKILLLAGEEGKSSECSAGIGSVEKSYGASLLDIAIENILNREA